MAINENKLTPTLLTFRNGLEHHNGDVKRLHINIAQSYIIGLFFMAYQNLTGRGC